MPRYIQRPRVPTCWMARMLQPVMGSACASVPEPPPAVDRCQLASAAMGVASWWTVVGASHYHVWRQDQAQPWPMVGETRMKKFLVSLVVSLLFVWPLVAGAQQQGKSPMGETPQPKGEVQQGKTPMGDPAQHKGDIQQRRVDVNKPLDQAQMRDIEARLKAAGFDPGPVDGTFTAQTDKALREYQQKHGLRVTGLIGDETLKEIMAPQARSGATPSKTPDTERTPSVTPPTKTMPSEPMPGGTTPGGTR